MNDNKILRKKMQTKRLKMPPTEVISSSKIIADKLMLEIKNHSFNNILCYYPTKNEVNLLDLYDKLLKLSYNLYFPITNLDTIKFFKVDNLLDFTIGTFNINEPNDKRYEFTHQEALVITPGLAFDKYNNRIGYGKGYYDRFLQSHPNTYSIGVCYKYQVCDKINTTSLDVPVKKIITD